MAAIRRLNLTQSDVHHLFTYDDGKLYWRHKHKRFNPGDLAGGYTTEGYWRVKFGSRSYKRARLVWLYLTGEDSYPFPLDHIDRNRGNDRIDNLRIGTPSVNNSNRTWGASRYRYVYLTDEGRWRARISGKISLGVFSTEKEAANAISEWEKSQ